jgi:hypothetical protein
MVSREAGIIIIYDYPLPSITFILAASAGFNIVELPTFRRRLAFLLLIKWPEKLFLAFTLPEAVTLTLFFKPLCVFCLGIWLNLPYIKLL